MGLFAALLAWNVHYVLAALLATQGSTIWLFALTDRWVFRARSFTRGLAKRVGLYFALNNAGFVARGLLLVALVSGLGLGALVANLITLVALTLVRFFVADSWIWHRRADTGPIAYDVHGIVTVQSEVALPELARFRVASLDGAPDVDVKLGQLHDTGKDLADDLVFATRHIHYDDGLGRLGFAVQIRKGRTTEIAASRLVGASPHVLYTNVVEPVLRWRIVASGYALVHAACVAFDGRAVFRNSADRHSQDDDDPQGARQLSVRVHLRRPDPADAGRTRLTYPKPLTVSKHTVGAVKTPNLTFKQRLGLPLQSRIHSKSGRAFAFLLEKLHLPVATINALLQVIVPPPKYHVDKLVPTVTCVTDAQLAGVVVIERADNDEELALSGLEATDLLISNTEDAYGFPPYPTIAHSLHGEGSDDLRVNEREIIAAAVGELPASILRRRERDWWQHLPTMVAELRVVADDDTDEGGPEPPSQEPPFSDPLPQLPDLEPGAESEPIEIDASTARATTAQPPRPPAIVGSVEHMADAPTSLATSSAPALEHRNGSRSVTQAVSRVGDELSRLAQLASARRAAIASSTGSLTQLPSYEMFRPRTRLASFTISRSVAVAIALGTVLAIGSFVRLWALNRYGFNSDEAVYGGQGASIAGHAELSEFFPTFRAHPLLYQSVLSLGFYLGGFDLFARFVSVGIGLVTVYLTYRVGTLSYNRRVGLIAAALMALMPYHVLVSRQVLLDAPMAMFATLACTSSSATRSISDLSGCTRPPARSA